jgi:hypothetical protein
VLGLTCGQLSLVNYDEFVTATTLPDQSPPKGTVIRRLRGAPAVVTLALSLTAACGNPAASTPTTGLTGVVVRGPITPVCQLDVPCDAPFSAGFTVEQDGRSVARFRSDTNGHFTVWLRPGTYRVVPDRDAPLLVPASQARAVDVGQTGLTNVRLAFDTGIR